MDRAVEVTELILGQRIREAREAAGLRQEDLARAVGVDQPRISRFESGRDIGSILLSRIATVTNKDLGFFLDPQRATTADFLFKKGQADEPEIERAIDTMHRIVRDYEFLRQVEP